MSHISFLCVLHSSSCSAEAQASSPLCQLALAFLPKSVFFPLPLASSWALPSFQGHIASGCLFCEPSFLTVCLCTKSRAPCQLCVLHQEGSPVPAVLHADNLGHASTCQLAGRVSTLWGRLAVASLPTVKDNPFLGVWEEPVTARS